VEGIVFGIQITECVTIVDGTVLTYGLGKLVGTRLLVIMTLEVTPGIGITYLVGRDVTAVTGTITGETMVGGTVIVGGNGVQLVNEVTIVQVYQGLHVFGGVMKVPAGTISKQC